ncbi:phage Gp37/Gp68 family protein [Chryseobacterium antibioticum]|uniref:Phage Gp37/Gp68 family protein n=1 Tax=Chryseobacterium pyrolae TaxID=2987481 RepID=A0ABT2IMH3_9FLAO|nr:phage Gp37/Gp68 family protein [Chryseobacterium pyrolae]MCT2409816.1 phage Gp37/Gp68 family protein [Chryseobacterium pyrolae]
MNLKGIDWIIVSGESGRKPRTIKEEWVTDMKNQCLEAEISFFFKQWGRTNKKKTG